MPSQWADYGFPDGKFRTLEKLNHALDRAYSERYYWRYLFSGTFGGDYTGSINDYIPEFRDTLYTWYNAREIRDKSSIYGGISDILGYRLGPYYSDPYAIKEEHGYYNDRGIIHNFDEKNLTWPVADSVVSRIPIGRDAALVSGDVNYNPIITFNNEYQKRFFLDFCYSINGNPKHYLKFVPLRKLYRKMYEYVNAMRYQYIISNHGMTITEGGTIRMRQEALDFLGDTRGFFLCRIKDGEQYLWYRVAANTSPVETTYFVLLLDLSSVLKFYDPPQE